MWEAKIETKTDATFEILQSRFSPNLTSGNATMNILPVWNNETLYKLYILLLILKVYITNKMNDTIKKK